MLWVLRGAEVKTHGRFGHSLDLPGFVKFIWEERGVWMLLVAWVASELGPDSDSILSKLLKPFGFHLSRELWR